MHRFKKHRVSQEDKFKIYSYACYKIQDTNKKEQIFKATKDKRQATYKEAIMLKADDLIAIVEARRQ